VPSKDPRAVLGVEPDATPDEIKAAWRALARRHHPDLTGDDPEIAQRATRRMAEINAAYAALTRGPRAQRARSTAPPAGSPPRTKRPGGPPPERPTRPVTGRVDTSATALGRNRTTTPPGTPQPLRGHAPLRHDRSTPELRASQPSGPLEYDRLDGHVPREAPDLDDALTFEVDFGKFHGHTLGEIAAFEPSYIDWLAGTQTRDPEVAMAARVIVGELDRRGIRRVHRPARPGWHSNPFR
jgi:curved DNA-binding protein CbpA